MQQISIFIEKYLSTMHVPKTLMWTDIAEIFIISFVVYQLLAWIRNTRTWALLRGVFVILAFLLVAAFFNMSTILWIAGEVFSIAAIAIVIILQPELRRALEQIGQKSFMSALFPFDTGKTTEGSFTEKTAQEIVKACYEMGKVKTGALIVIENTSSLAEYERTGIEVDGLVSSQLLINIFEHNTPLPDGAVIIRDNLVYAAGCFLPKPQKEELINKELGSRHRAAIGMSEVSDAIVIIVSEEILFYRKIVGKPVFDPVFHEDLRCIRSLVSPFLYFYDSGCSPFLQDGKFHKILGHKPSNENQK